MTCNARSASTDEHEMVNELQNKPHWLFYKKRTRTKIKQKLTRDDHSYLGYWSHLNIALFSPPPTSYIFKNFVSIPSIFKENKTKPTVKEKNKLKGSPKLGNISPDIRLRNCNLLIHEQYEQQLPSSLNDQRHQRSTLCSEEKNTNG